MKTIDKIRKMKAAGEKIAMLTAYDASFAKLMSDKGVDMLLVGDSLGMAIQGKDSTLPVTLEEMCYHTSLVARGNSEAMVVADMPFGSYPDKWTAFKSAAALMKSGAHMVKFEGADEIVPIVEHLTQRGIPVCAHIGLTPQFINAIGGYKVQGRGEGEDVAMGELAKKLDEAGADIVLVECVKNSAAKAVMDNVSCPVIGIGAGNVTDGQVLVCYDMLNVYPGRKARFVRNFMEGQNSIGDAIEAYVKAVKDGSYPNESESYEE